MYLLRDDLALVQTVDFFTPIVDDPFLFGAIAAANSLSDIYAMGGRPISALSLVAFPPKCDTAILEAILQGGLSKMVEAGCTVIGGHSIRDDELKFGYAVTGLIHPDRIWRNVGAQPGDLLLLTKPLGTGLIATALKNARASDASLAAATAAMVRLNRDAAEALHRIAERDASAGAIHAVTDITGFGLLGHAREMALGKPPDPAAPSAFHAPKVTIELDHSRIEVLPGALDAARDGFIAGGLKNNREWLEGCVEFASSLPEEWRCLLFDPQTSGGLFIAIAPDAADAALAEMAARQVPARIIGRVLPKGSSLLRVV